MQANRDWWQSSLYGLCRSMLVQGVIAPIDTMKVRIRAYPDDIKIHHLAKEIIQNEGAFAFYRGLVPEFWKIVTKSLWSWPMMTKFPSYLHRQGCEELKAEAITGLAIAKVDALSNLWLDKRKQMLLLSSRNSYSMEHAINDGMRGFGALWLKLSVSWSTFLVAQKYFRRSDRPLTSLDLFWIGMKVTIIVGTVTAPFDFYTSMKFAQNVSLSDFLLKGRYYRGFSLYITSLSVHNIASIILLDKLEK